MRADFPKTGDGISHLCARCPAPSAELRMISCHVVQITQGMKNPEGMPRGRAGVPPAVFRILRNTYGRRERCVHKLMPSRTNNRTPSGTAGFGEDGVSNHPLHVVSGSLGTATKHDDGVALRQIEEFQNGPPTPQPQHLPGGKIRATDAPEEHHEEYQRKPH